MDAGERATEAVLTVPNTVPTSASALVGANSIGVIAVVVNCGESVEIGEKELETTGDVVDVARLSKKSELRIEAGQKGEKWWRQGSAL